MPVSKTGAISVGPVQLCGETGITIDAKTQRDPIFRAAADMAAACAEDGLNKLGGQAPGRFLSGLAQDLGGSFVFEVIKQAQSDTWPYLCALQEDCSLLWSGVDGDTPLAAPAHSASELLAAANHGLAIHVQCSETAWMIALMLAAVYRCA